MSIRKLLISILELTLILKPILITIRELVANTVPIPNPESILTLESAQEPVPDLEYESASESLWNLIPSTESVPGSSDLELPPLVC